MQEQLSQQQSITIQVNPQIKPENPQNIKKVTEEESLKSRAKNIQSWKSDCPNNLLNLNKGHGLVNTIWLAYSQHYNLELSPDDIWLLILQGFSAHLEVNHEKLRSKFVDFDGKKELWIRRDHFIWGKNENDWAGCFEEWCQQIKENIGEQNHQNLVPKFTSSTQISQACFNATLMDSMKNYFSFGCRTCCGIPEIKLNGSLEDWQELRKRTQNLGQYELKWWTEKLLPILDKFIEAREGKKVDQVFWNCIYKIVPAGGGSGAVTTVTGWITNFFPYINEYKGKEQNRYMKSLDEIYKNYENLSNPKNVNWGWGGPKGIMEKELIQGGMTETPFKWEYYGEDKKMKILAGFHNTGFEGNFLKPAKGWAIAEREK